MKAILYNFKLQWKMDFRNKNILLIYYIVPIFFFLFMSGIFTSIDSSYKGTLIQSMTVFSVTMGAILGAPVALIQLYNNDILKSYKVSNIPLLVPMICNFISAFINLFIVSLIIFAIAPLIYGAALPKNIPLFFVILVCFLLASISIGTVLGLIIKNSSKLTLLGQIIFLPSIMLSGIMFPTDMLPRIVKNIGYIFPASISFKGMIDFKLIYIFILLSIFILMISFSIFRLRKLDKQ